jgi:hypothetical protein
MTTLRHFFEALPWERLRPAQDVLAEQPGAIDPAHFIAVAASPRDGLIVLYLPVGGAVRLKPERAAQIRSGRWFNPRTGEYTGRVALREPRADFTAPDTEDWLLLIEAP